MIEKYYFLAESVYCERYIIATFVMEALELIHVIMLKIFFIILFNFLSQVFPAEEPANNDAVSRSRLHKNPLNIRMGDPFILYNDTDDTFYMYGTTDPEKGFRAYASKNLTEWKDLGMVYEKSALSWGKDCFWAPEVYVFDNKFYMFYSANWKHNPLGKEEVFRIGVAVSDSPRGPFQDLHDNPVFDPGYPIIDANVFKDEDGQFYLYYSRCCYEHPVESELSRRMRASGYYFEIEESWIYGVRLKPDFSGTEGEPTLILTPPAEMADKQTIWESQSVLSMEANRRWTEGSFIIKENGKYFIMYSANFFGGQHYSVGYAVSDNPLGPFVKSPDNPILQKNNKNNEHAVSGTGHCMALRLKNGKMVCVYHARTPDTGDARVVFIDPMEITDDGKIIVYGPNTLYQNILD